MYYGRRVWSRLQIAVAAWVGWRLLGPEPAPRFTGPQSRPEGPPGRSVMVGRHEYFVREAGPEDAPKVLLIHGWLYDSHMTWHRVLPHLTDRFRVIAIDLRNHGRSERIRGRFDVSDLADEVARLLDVLGEGPLPVVGYSLGGMVAQDLAIRSPARVTGLVLGATAAKPVRLPVWFALAGLIAARAVSRIDRFLMPRLAHTYLLRSGVIPHEHGAWLWQSILDRDTDLYFRAGFAIAQFDVRQKVSAIKVPTTIIIPSDDQMVSPRQQHETAELIEQATVVELQGARHEAVITHGDEVAKAIMGMLDGLV